ncbi:hypothetical protein ES703_90970 [subsurface metagenome]
MKQKRSIQAHHQCGLSSNVSDYQEKLGVASNNKLNDLTGKEWKFATRSVISKPYPINMQHKLRRQHGGQKPPELCADLIRTFTKKGALVLDPLAGVGGTLLGAILSHRRAIGFEINKKWIDIYYEVCTLENFEPQPMQLGDAKVLLKSVEENSIDFILTDVPYWVMDKVTKTRSRRAPVTHLSSFNHGTQNTKEVWLEEMKAIFTECQRVLRWNRYLAIFVGDMYRGKQYHMLGAELAQAIENKHLVLKANLVWYDVSKNLHVYGYPSAFIPSMIHQNILVLRKE